MTRLSSCAALLLSMTIVNAQEPAAPQPAVSPPPPPPAASQLSSGASVTIAGGPLKGEYDYSEPCVVASFSKRPLGVSVVLHGTDSVLSIDMPVLDDKRANEIQIVLVIADVNSGKGQSSVTYEIDTRPDSVLEPFQKAERANKGMTGKVTTTLMTKNDNTLISFTGKTASGIQLEGSLTCKRVT
jgi:hypothetical protein